MAPRWPLRVWIAVYATLVTVLVYYSLVTDSRALLSESVHCFGDLIFFGVMAAIQVLSVRPATMGMPFGWRRLEAVGGLAGAIFVASSSVLVLLEAIGGLIEGNYNPTRPGVIIVLGLTTFAVNLSGAVFLHLMGTPVAHGHSHAGEGRPRRRGGHHHHHHHDDQHHHHRTAVEPRALTQVGGATVLAPGGDSGDPELGDAAEPQKRRGADALAQAHDDLTLRGVLLHLCTDGLSSLVVAGAGLAQRHWNDPLRAPLVDFLACLLVVCISVASAMPLLRESTLMLLDSAPPRDQVDVVAARDALLGIEGVKHVVSLRMWKADSSTTVAMVDLHVDADAAAASLAASVDGAAAEEAGAGAAEAGGEEAGEIAEEELAAVASDALQSVGARARATLRGHGADLVLVQVRVS